MPFAEFDDIDLFAVDPSLLDAPRGCTGASSTRIHSIEATGAASSEGSRPVHTISGSMDGVQGPGTGQGPLGSVKTHIHKTTAQLIDEKRRAALARLHR